MSLLERLNQDMKLYMKNREKDKLTVVRMVKASLQNEAIKLASLDWASSSFASADSAILPGR